MDNGISRKVSPLAGPDANTTFNVDPTLLLASSQTLNRIMDPSVSGDGAVGSMTWFSRKRSDSSDSIRTQSRPLAETMQAATKNYTAMVAHDRLRTETSVRASGVKSINTARWQASIGVCSSMAAVSGVCAVFVLLVLQYSRQMTSCYHRDPFTLLGSIIHLCESPERRPLIQPPMSELLRETKEARKVAWSQAAHAPLVLTFYSRILLVSFVLALIIGLPLALQKSQESDGLLTDDGGFWPLILQLSPVLAMLFVSLYSSSSDIAMRSLAALSDLSAQPCSASKVDLSLLDMLGVRVLHHSIHLGVPAITTTQFLGVLCSFLPIISSVLLNEQNMPKIVNIHLKGQDWFGSRMITEDNVIGFSENRENLSYLNMLQRISNFTYSENTYLDLLFPRFHINDPSWVPGASAKVKTSAAKLSPSCQRLTEDNFRIVNETFGSTDFEDARDTEKDLWMLKLYQEFDCLDDIRRNVSLTLTATLQSGQLERGGWYFGESMPSPANSLVRYVACNDAHPNSTSPSWLALTYVWGRYSHIDSVLEHLSVWECNYTWVDVTTEVNLLWSEGDGNILIDHNNPPVQDESSTRPWIPPFGVPVLDNTMLQSDLEDALREADRYGSLPSAFEFPREAVSNHQYGVTYQFQHLVKPYGPIVVEDLSDPDQEDRILELLHSKLTFAAAQLATIEQRLESNETSDSEPWTFDERLREPVAGTITDNLRLRVVQNSNITFTLIAILSLVAAVHIWALASQGWRRFSSPGRRRRPWLLDLERRGVAPPNFSSIAMMASLLDGSNCSSVLPKNAHLMAPKELHQHLAGKEFRLGWFSNTETGLDVYTIGVLDEGNLVFRGPKSGVTQQVP